MLVLTFLLLLKTINFFLKRFIKNVFLSSKKFFFLLLIFLELKDKVEQESSFTNF